MIIDFHTHIFPPRIRDFRDQYAEKDPLFHQLYSNPKAKLVTAEDLITAMNKETIDASVILNLAWGNAELCRETNDYIIESIKKYPQRLYGFCMVDFNSPDLALEELERCVKHGIKGVGEVRFSNEQLRNLHYLQPVMNYIIENNLIMVIHTTEPIGHHYPGKGDTTPDYIYPFIHHFSGLKLVCAHWGGGLPFYSLMPKARSTFAHVYFDSAASPYLYSPRIYTLVAELVGDNRMLFGTDYPLLSPKRLLKEIDSLNIPEPARSRILYANAAELLEINNK
jgi:uncharacterized protein